MHDFSELNADHALFKELRNGLLWHCTCPKRFHQIRADGFIKPNDGRMKNLGTRPQACQQFGAISLFDFTTEAEARILQVADKWHSFLGYASPLTVIIGMPEQQLPGKLVRYPENRDRTPDAIGPIPWVEVCHCGSIPVPAIAKYVLVYSGDYSQFRVFEHDKLDESVLLRSQKEFEELARVKHLESAEAAEEIMEFNKRLAKARKNRIS